MCERLLTLIGRIIGVSKESIGENSSQENVEYWDSFAHMNVILALEEEFNVSFTDVEIMQIEKNSEFYRSSCSISLMLANFNKPVLIL